MKKRVQKPKSENKGEELHLNGQKKNKLVVVVVVLT